MDKGLIAEALPVATSHLSILIASNSVSGTCYISEFESLLKEKNNCRAILGINTSWCRRLTMLSADAFAFGDNWFLCEM